MASSPAHEVVLAYVPIPMPPTNGLIEVLRRQNLGIELSTGCHHERLVHDRIDLLEYTKSGTKGSRRTYHLALSLQGISEFGVRKSIEK